MKQEKDQEQIDSNRKEFALEVDEDPVEAGRQTGQQPNGRSEDSLPDEKEQKAAKRTADDVDDPRQEQPWPEKPNKKGGDRP